MILVFGQTGQVAHELARLLPEATFLNRDAADLTKPEICAQAIRDAQPDLVINAAAYTAVDKAEEDEDTAALVNAASPTAMAGACAELGVPFVHISTDYVFNGQGDTPFAPGAATGPINAYGRTKLAGEEGVRASGAVHAILRVSWVFSAHGNNFVKTMLRLGADRDKLTIVADQIGGPTPAGAIADACHRMGQALRTDPALSGTYHLSGAPDTSWAGFAREIFAQAGLTVDVEDVPSTAYPTPAKRPGNSRMDCATTQAAFGIARPDWRAGIAAVLTELET